VSERLFTFEGGIRKDEVVASGEGEVLKEEGHQTSNLDNCAERTTSSVNLPTSSVFKGIPYSDIIAEWWRRNGGEPSEGERNVKLHKLAVNLRAICDNKKDLLLSIMPRCGLSETELKSIIDSACKEIPKGVSKMMTSIIDDLSLTIDHDGDEEIDDDSNNGQLSMFNVQCSMEQIARRSERVVDWRSKEHADACTLFGHAHCRHVCRSGEREVLRRDGTTAGLNVYYPWRSGKRKERVQECGGHLETPVG
jgi:hypothetical protein